MHYWAYHQKCHTTISLHGDIFFLIYKESISFTIDGNTHPNMILRNILSGCVFQPNELSDYTLYTSKDPGNAISYEKNCQEFFTAFNNGTKTFLIIHGFEGEFSSVLLIGRKKNPKKYKSEVKKYMKCRNKYLV